jgi:deoxyribodipyrimidine photo-lyase
MFHCTVPGGGGIRKKVDPRVNELNDKPVRSGARYVLFWSQMNRRVESNHALEYAATRSNELGLPLLVYEGLTCTYPYANDRFHTFLLEGVPDTAKALAKRGIGYVFYLRRRKADRDDVFYRLAADAALAVTDDYPTFIARGHNASVPKKLDIPYYAVDSSCIVPMSQFEKREYAAYTIRPKIKRMLPEHLHPVERVRLKHKFDLQVPEFHTEVTAENIPQLVCSCEIDHSIRPSLSFRGGSAAAEKHLEVFLDKKLRRYAADRNEPSKHVTSDLSPYLHFGHISSLHVALSAKAHAERNSLIAEEFLEELIVRRELAFNYARFVEKPDTFDNLPEWARQTLQKHDRDPRQPSFTREQMEQGRTYDDLWNATQKELLLRGKIHGYYRMYWGKKIMEWAPTHQEALDTMVYLHDRYSLDGRDPNTYTNILWCFGLHDRPWTERPIFGMTRYMSYDGMKRKTDIAAYLKEISFLEQTGKDPFRVQ